MQSKLEPIKVDPKIEKTVNTALENCCICNEKICDFYIMVSHEGFKFHANCLKCCECNCQFDNNSKCFLNYNSVYCVKHYKKLKSTNFCLNCLKNFSSPDEFVVCIKGRLFHKNCFNCRICKILLNSGDEFTINSKGNILCHNHSHLFDEEKIGYIQDNRSHSEGKFLLKFKYIHKEKYHTFERTSSLSRNSDVPKCEPHFKSKSKFDSLFDSKAPDLLNKSLTNTFISDSIVDNDTEYDQTKIDKKILKKSKSEKTTRVRTVLNEKQLQMLRSCYITNPRPDALVKEQLVEMTGLTSRVIRVWFQNKRCKDKKQCIIMKQIQEQHIQESQNMPNCKNSINSMSMIADKPISSELLYSQKSYEIEKCFLKNPISQLNYPSSNTSLEYQKNNPYNYQLNYADYGKNYLMYKPHTNSNNKKLQYCSKNIMINENEKFLYKNNSKIMNTPFNDKPDTSQSNLTFQNRNCNLFNQKEPFLSNNQIQDNHCDDFVHKDTNYPFNSGQNVKFFNSFNNTPLVNFSNKENFSSNIPEKYPLNRNHLSIQSTNHLSQS
ncbi:hypothetical protein A3Q56_03067 [Intoshia linei]|uniref:Uncharacterized protein n=1 Tax=Intoshia linei TaxID=1819745 RepID=A0A177B6I2_9BILA|nr:hypothetical protein A3Q56_03067 [Intoshia linei]